MPLIEESVVIRAPRESIWEFAAQPDNVTVWQSNLIEFELLGRPPVRVGSEGRGAVRVAGRTMRCTQTATTWVANETVTWSSTDSPIDFTYTASYRVVPGGTEVTVHVETGPLGTFFGNIADPVVARMYAHDVTSNLAQLKALMEG